MDDPGLINRCRQDDLDAFQALFKQYGAKALRTAYLITGRRDIAEDIVQEAFILCYREIKGLRQPEAFPAWFYRILVRVGWRVMSKEKKLRSLDHNQEPPATYVLEESQEDLYDALRRLSLPLRTTVIMHYFGGPPIKEISEITGCREGTVKSRLHNARKQLAAELRERGWAGPHLEEECLSAIKENVKELDPCEAK